MVPQRQQVRKPTICDTTQQQQARKPTICATKTSCAVGTTENRKSAYVTEISSEVTTSYSYDTTRSAISTSHYSDNDENPALDVCYFINCNLCFEIIQQKVIHNSYSLVIILVCMLYNQITMLYHSYAYFSISNQ